MISTECQERNQTNWIRWWHSSVLCSAGGITTLGSSCRFSTSFFCFKHLMFNLNLVNFFRPSVPQFLAALEMLLISLQHSQLFNYQRLVNLFTCNSDQLCLCIYLKKRLFTICMCPLIVFLFNFWRTIICFTHNPQCFCHYNTSFVKLNVLPVKINTRRHGILSRFWLESHCSHMREEENVAHTIFIF